MYGLTILLGAFLLFAVEPMAAKGLLPLLGGSSAVWLAALCFFQCVLLLGYAYTYALTTWWGGHRRALASTHSGLLLLGLLLSLTMLNGPRIQLAGATRHPALAIFVSLLQTVGLPFLLLSATSPLLQVWLARRSGAAIPYRLFALSNAGSFLALLAYPLVIEPWLPLRIQRLAWTAGFAIYAGLCSSIALRHETETSSLDGVETSPPELQRGHRRGEDDVPDSEAYGGAHRSRALLCFALSAAAAMQLCAVTSHLTQNIAAIPLLWVLPLGVYLLSFVLAFELPTLYRRGLLVRVLVVMLASLGYLLSKTDVSLPISMGIAFFLLELFCACWFCHSEVYALRPSGTNAAAGFYLLVAAGGAAGTFFIAVLSPLVFQANYDLPLAFAATAAVALAVTWSEGWAQRMLWGVSTVLCVALVGMLYNGYRLGSLVNVRNFYGSLRVRQSDQPQQAGTSRTLMHGAIKHGMQWFAEDFRREPTTYYARDSGVGLALGWCCEGRPRRIGVVGLGAGTLAAYGRDGDTIRFYEINPLVEGIAQELFSYTRESRARVTVVDGDARISLEHETPRAFDVLVLDAFSGDAIPVHLLTIEALREYRRHMAPGGIIAFHISNQYLDLAPVLRRLAETEHMEARLVNSGERPERGEFAARWVLLSDDDALFRRKEFSWAAERIPDRSSVRLWTDDYSSLLPIVRWGAKR